MSNKIISPIAIDMGAKNTGVYYAQYKQGASFEQIEKQGQVLVYDKYTALLRDRTANRHVRRGYQRKKLAKRLLTIILQNYFNFPAKKHTQAIGFLLNRRGFSFLEEEYSKEHLEALPDEVWAELSDKIKKSLNNDKEKIADRLIYLASNKPNKITDIFNAIEDIEGYKNFQDTKNEIKKDFVYCDYIEKIVKACNLAIKNDIITDDKVLKNAKDKQKISATSNWIIERLNKKHNLSLNIDDTTYKTDLIKQITQTNAQVLKSKLHDFESERNQTKNRETENNRSIWNFNISEFKFNPKNEKGLEDNKTQTYLHHLCYAIYKINNEIISGGRHRSKYFEEIAADLERFAEKNYLNNKHSPQYIKEFITDIKDNKYQLGINNKLYKLVCHVSNFELKPLRAYFNDKTPIKKGKEHQNNPDNFISHKDGDKFDNEKLSRLASTWFVKNWRVSEEKDNQEKVKDYEKLKKLWKEHKNKKDIISFWLKTDPILTIPPYSSMNNRKPPKCQSLLLNSDYLDRHYPKWQQWLDLLKPNDEYQRKLENLKSGKEMALIDNNDSNLINLRQLQFILDVAKKQDKYKFNEIWSIQHKLQQLKKSDADDKQVWQDKLDEARENSKLPDELKQELNGDFGHFINKYYKTRGKARDGRYFLIQEKKEKWRTEGKLLILCPHKPRQKKYQWRIDLAAILGIDSEQLKTKIGNQDPEDWLMEINGFKSACEDSAKAQKDHRGELKFKISKALAEIDTGKDAKKLKKLANKCYGLKDQLVKKIDIDNLLADKQAKENDQKIALVFKFAQINNIVFKDRNGFSKTCQVCSTDNAFRMQENDEGFAFASRLPALSIRLIDGVVMRICDAISRQVAKTKWIEIEKKLQGDKKFSIPIIMEQNRFEFEPSLANIKGKSAKDEKDNRETEYSDKEKRIKDFAQGICAYHGTSLGKDGEYDHIIPQASKYGTLNDEANLIYVSQAANQGKSRQTYHLTDLDQKYKNKIFNKTDEEIKQFIYDELEDKQTVDEDSDYFAFGRYLSFINLNEDQQKAFRHALFLEDDPLKNKVINALQNRNRTIVNGTQRYLAQCIADKIYKIAKQSKKQKNIEFDYFEYSARGDIPNSTYNLRKEYGIVKSKKQPLHSHLIDAQMAFLLATDEHKSLGSMGLKFETLETIKQGIDTETGEVLPKKFYDLTFISESEFTEVNLSRKKSATGVRLSRSFHRPNFYAENYVPLFFGKKDSKIEIKAGFSWENSVKLSASNNANILSILVFSKNQFIANSKFNTIEDLYANFDKKTKCGDFEIFYIDWDKTKIQKHLVDNYSNKDIVNGKQWNNEIVFLRKLSYRIKKETIKNLQDIQDVLNSIEIGKTKKKNYFSVKLFNQEIELPAKQDWEKLLKKWNTKGRKKFNGEFGDFLKDYFRKEKNFAEENKGCQTNNHQKVRKVFSLPVVNALGHFLQKRKSWNGKDIYQILADSDSRKDGNKFSRLVLTSDGEFKEIINQPFVSKNIFKLKFEDIEVSKDYYNINPNKWFEIQSNDDFPNGVQNIFYKVDNATRPQIKIYLLEGFKTEDIDDILSNPLTKAKAKAKENDKLKKILESANQPQSLEYTASGFNQSIKKKLLDKLK